VGLIDILQLFGPRTGCSVQLHYILALHEIVHEGGDEEQRHIQVADALQGLQLFDVEAVVLLNSFSEVVHDVLDDETWQDGPFGSDLLHEGPEGGVGGVENAGNDVFSGLGFTHVEDNSK
jgi:hypothetical protein